jgi:hypothetical protein
VRRCNELNNFHEKIRLNWGTAAIRKTEGWKYTKLYFPVLDIGRISSEGVSKRGAKENIWTGEG